MMFYPFLVLFHSDPKGLSIPVLTMKMKQMKAETTSRKNYIQLYIAMKLQSGK